MKKLIYLLCLGLFVSCSNPTTDNTADTKSGTEEVLTEGYKDIDQETFKSRMNQPGVFILDVRTPAETNEGKIRGAVEVDFRGPGFKDKINRLPKDKEYLVYCMSGGRSSETAQIMMDLGFTNVSNLLGGYSEWKE